MSSSPQSNRVSRRNFDPTPAPCRVSFDKDGHAIALTDLERSGKPSPTPTPMYAGVTANTPRVSSISGFILHCKLRAYGGFLRILCPIVRTHTRKARSSTQLIKSFISIKNSTLPNTLPISDSVGWSLGCAIRPRAMLQTKSGWSSGLSL